MLVQPREIPLPPSRSTLRDKGRPILQPSHEFGQAASFTERHAPAELVEEVQQEDHVVLRFLRSLRRDGGHQRHDAPPIPRAKLYVPYLRFVEAFAPVALLMENVPDVLNHGGTISATIYCGRPPQTTIVRLGIEPEECGSALSAASPIRRSGTPHARTHRRPRGPWHRRTAGTAS